MRGSGRVGCGGGRGAQRGVSRAGAVRISMVRGCVRDSKARRAGGG